MSLIFVNCCLFRKSENQSSEAGISGEVMQEPRVVVQSSADTEITGDGFRWRKYGQKVVKGNPYPRLELLLCYLLRVYFDIMKVIPYVLAKVLCLILIHESRHYF